MTDLNNLITKLNYIFEEDTLKSGDEGYLDIIKKSPHYKKVTDVVEDIKATGRGAAEQANDTIEDVKAIGRGAAEQHNIKLPQSNKIDLKDKLREVLDIKTKKQELAEKSNLGFRKQLSARRNEKDFSELTDNKDHDPTNIKDKITDNKEQLNNTDEKSNLIQSAKNAVKEIKPKSDEPTVMKTADPSTHVSNPNNKSNVLDDLKGMGKKGLEHVQNAYNDLTTTQQALLKGAGIATGAIGAGVAALKGIKALKNKNN